MRGSSVSQLNHAPAAPHPPRRIEAVAIQRCGRRCNGLACGSGMMAESHVRRRLCAVPDLHEESLLPRSHAFAQVDVFGSAPYLGNPLAVIARGGITPERGDDAAARPPHRRRVRGQVVAAAPDV
jgi:hypothetical protein